MKGADLKVFPPSTHGSGIGHIIRKPKSRWCLLINAAPAFRLINQQIALIVSYLDALPQKENTDSTFGLFDGEIVNSVAGSLEVDSAITKRQMNPIIRF